MKTLLFSILLSTGLLTVAQTSITDGNCKAFFKYEVNDKMMFPYAATAINFYDLSTGKVKEWYWDFGDGNTSREQNPIFIFKHPVSSPNVKINLYRTVSLTILADSCKSYYSVTINIMDGTQYIQPACKAWFMYNMVSADSLTGTTTVQFINLSEGDSLSYLWLFDDGKTIMEPAPKVTFKLKPAKRLVCLTVSGKSKCTHTFCDSVTLYNPVVPKPEECYAYFGYTINYNIKTFAPALVLDFYPKTPPGVIEWKWDFGDGTNSSEAKPTHIFNLPLGKDSLSTKRSLFRRVSLTIRTVSGCVATWSDSINIFTGTTPPVDYINNTGCKYTMRITSGFPIQMSSCAGYAHAQVYLKDSLIKAVNYAWSDGTSGQDVKNLCPTRTYTVKAQTSDGCVVSCNFIFNSDGTVKEIPINWWISGYGDSQVIRSNLNDKNLTVEWKLCDGTIVKSDTIPLNSINCSAGVSNLILRDSTGNVVYSENISFKNSLTGIHFNQTGLKIMLFPNPVDEILQIQYSGNHLNELYIEIFDISGRRMSVQKFCNIETGQQFNLDVNSLGKGIYLCKMILDKQGIVIEKFSK